ncbi:mitochondrial phosphate carrier protein [Diaporthe eres]
MSSRPMRLPFPLSPAVQAFNPRNPISSSNPHANEHHEYSVKTRIQLDPATYNRGMIGGFKQVIQNEGAGALLTGFGPTAAGYFLQGAFKFGGYEFFKQQSINLLGYENASNYRTGVYLASSAAGEFFADIALCPLEATRIRLVSEPTYASGLLSGFTKIAKQEGIGAFYAGFGPILFKQ